jgi:hypothetical protein
MWGHSMGGQNARLTLGESTISGTRGVSEISWRPIVGRLTKGMKVWTVNDLGVLAGSAKSIGGLSLRASSGVTKWPEFKDMYKPFNDFGSSRRLRDQLAAYRREPPREVIMGGQNAR